MRISVLFSVVLVFCLSMHSQSRGNATIAYINKYAAYAIEQEHKYGVPAPVTLAQGILESGSGTSKLTRNTNNHFGIKSHGKKGKVYLAKDDDPGLSSFRVYATARDSYEDHSKFLLENSRRYGSLFRLNKYDYRGWCWGLQNAGYATNPQYAVQLIQTIEVYRLYKINEGVKMIPRKAKKSTGGTIVKRIKTTTTTTVTTTTAAPEEIPDMEFVEDDVESDEEREYNRLMSLPYVTSINGVRCKRIYPGDLVTNIAIDNDMSTTELLEYNEMKNLEDFNEGDIVYLEKKKNKFNGSQDDYTVVEGDTWHSIAQQFGVNYTFLLKKNKKNYFTAPVPGEKLKLK